MNYSEFERKIVKSDVRRLAKIRNSWGVKDAYRKVRKESWQGVGQPIDESIYYAIIRKVNGFLADEIAKGNDVIFPFGMGKLELRKFETKAYFKGDQVRVNYPVDWKSTLKLWYEDDEERKKKTLVRFHTPFVYTVKYCSKKANYPNKSFYQFSLNRFIKRALKNNIEKGAVDTLW